jgi:hypothetical protein
VAGAALILSEPDRQRLISWVMAGTTPQRVVKRARIVLLTADGLSMRAIARRLDLSPHTVRLWRQRFQECGANGLRRDAPGRGRKPSLGVDAATRIHGLLNTPPPRGPRWSIRALAEASGLSRASVHRIVRSLPVDADRRARRNRRSRL